ncbi:hypothetical protein SNE25_20965 [Mucilaginibacter sabulilitoris]|uniref:Tail assembly chaperone n=1 Tax=Mucilaginibacter sabulilitoris TaxID=1173583 RepID=A0ABZ0THC8_9SPHI|nr:hypothetical protein [Mucilaginibacter sabulilitoris]WPU91792.1 hypothetical protein SNE25_20965 [Mucilaginibacter sabulilitoris]
MTKNTIISKAVDVLTAKELYRFTIPVRYVEPVAAPPKLTRWEKLRGVKPEPIPEPETERSFEIWPAVVVNQYRIAGAAVTLPTDLFEDATKMMAYIPEHLPTMIYIIASAVQNNYLEPDPELIKFFERNLDNYDIEDILAASLQAVNMQSFMTSIVLMNGVAKILKIKTSPDDGRE